MTTFPNANVLSGAANEGIFKAAIEDFLAAAKQIPGAGIAETTLTLASDAVTPPAGGPGIFAIDTEASASNDNLATIAQTNLPDGSLILIHPANDARTVTAKHAAGGTGQILLRQGGDFTLGKTTHWLILKRTGTTWVEIGRFPREGVLGVAGKTSAYTVTEADRGTVINCTSGTFTLTLLAAARAGIGFDLPVRNVGIGVITIDPNGSETIDGATTLKLQPGHEIWIICDGANWHSISRYAPTPPRGHLWGLTLSNNATDATNDIDVAVGECASETSVTGDRVLLALTSALTKRIDAAWVAGTNQGGRASSTTLANGTWHVFAMRVAGADDVGFDTSVTGANLVADHGATAVRRIGSVLRESATIVGFVQDGDLFTRKATMLDVAASNPGTAAVTRTISVPTGIQVQAMIQAGVYANTNEIVGCAVYISDLIVNDEAAVVQFRADAISGDDAGTALAHAAVRLPVRTNTSAQVRSRISASSANTTFYINTLGWIDARGRLN